MANPISAVANALNPTGDMTDRLAGLAAGVSPEDWAAHRDYMVELQMQNLPGFGPSVPVYGEEGYHYLGGKDIAERALAADRPGLPLVPLAHGYQLFSELTDRSYNPSSYQTDEGTGVIGAVQQAMKDAKWNAAGVRAAQEVEELPFTLNPQNTLLPEQPAERGLYGPGSLGYNVRDEAARLAQLAGGRMSEYGRFDISPEVQSQASQDLIRSFTETPEVASLVSRSGDMRSSVDKALETYLPSAMGIYNQVDQFQEPLEATRQGIMSQWDADRETWDIKRNQGNIPGTPLAPAPITKEDQDRWDVRSHINLLFGEGGETPPEHWSDKRVQVRDAMMGIAEKAKEVGAQGVISDIGAWYKDRPPGAWSNIIPVIPGQKDVNKMADEYRAWDKYSNNAPAEEAKGAIINVDEDTGLATGAIVESLKDLVNNEVIKEGRDAGLTQEQVYNSPNLVFDPGQLSATARLLTEGDKKALTKNDVMELSTQVDSFSKPTVEWTPPVKQEVQKTEAPTQEQQAATVQALDVQRENLLRIEEKKEEQRQQAAADRAVERENQRIASKASAAAKRAEKKKIAAEKKVQAAFTAKVEKKKKEDAAKAAKQMQDFMKWSAAEHKRHQEEQRLRELRGYGWGEMWT